MKKSQIVAGRKYIARVSGKIVTVLVTRIRDDETPIKYDVLNIDTGRDLVFRSARRFHSTAALELFVGWQNKDGSIGCKELQEDSMEVEHIKADPNTARVAKCRAADHASAKAKFVKAWSPVAV